MPVQAKSKKAAQKKRTKAALPRKEIVARRRVLKKAHATILLTKKKKVRQAVPKTTRRQLQKISARPASPAKEIKPSGPVLLEAAHTAVDQSSGPKYFFSTDIPDHYDETYMRALPRDPLWIFAYWEISKTTIGGLKTALGKAFFGARWVLRVSDITDIDYNGANAWGSMDIDIAPGADNWYVKIGESGRVYILQAGLMTMDGAFSEAVRSNAVRMPNAGVSPVVDEEWLTAESNELIRMSAASLKRSIGASERMEDEFGLGQGSGSGAVL